MIIYAIILFFVALGIHLIADYKRWLKDRKIDHRKKLRTALWMVLLSPSIYLFTVSHHGTWYWVLACVLLMEFFCYVLIYDGLYSVLRGFNFWFLGSEDEGDAITDNFWQSIGVWYTKIIKITGSLLWVGVYIVSLFS